MSEHIDYITPGIAFREVESVKRADGAVLKRDMGGNNPILEPVLLPIEELLNNVLQFCDLAITPQCIKGKRLSKTGLYSLPVANFDIEMYNITDGTTSTKGNELGIFESIGDIYSQTDLNLFFTTLARYGFPILQYMML